MAGQAKAQIDIRIRERARPALRAHGHRQDDRAGWRGCRLPFPVHVHMLRHSTGYALAGRGMDTRRLQHYLAMPRSPIRCGTRRCRRSRSRTSGAKCSAGPFQVKAHNASITGLVLARTGGEGQAARSNIPSAMPSWDRSGSRTSGSDFTGRHRVALVDVFDGTIHPRRGGTMHALPSHLVPSPLYLIFATVTGLSPVLCAPARKSSGSSATQAWRCRVNRFPSSRADH